MPHFKTTKFHLPSLPFKATSPLGEFCFIQKFCSMQNPYFCLLQVCFTPKDSEEKAKYFFLEIKTHSKTPQKQETIVHFDKHSRISPIEIIKESLKILMSFQDSILTQNLQGKSLALKHKLPFIKNIEYFLDFKLLLEKQTPKLKKSPQDSPTKIWLEIGFGSGRHLLHNAKNHPEVLHIGLEIHRPSLEQVARQIGLLELKNLLILAYDARIFLELLPSNVLDRIFIHFPVPWDKQPNRRILSRAFLSQSSRTLKQNASLQLRTDSLEYFTYAKALAQDFKTDFHTESRVNTKGEIISKYEARWLREKKDIYNLEFFALHSSAPRKLDFDFSFLDSNSNPLHFLPKNFHKIKIVKKGYFLHLEDLFLNDSKSPQALLRVSFGDFHYPQTHYVLQANHIEYFRENPLPTSLNHQSHLQLLQVIQDDFMHYKEN